jgi:phage terminase large subunit-like protein
VDAEAELLALYEEEAEYVKFNRIEDYSPYPFQAEFHNDSAKFRSLNCGNRPGKTYCGAAEITYHLTGKYPDWWEGRKFDHPILALASGKNNEKTRDLVQKELFGDPADEKAWGTGWIPKDDIGETVRKPGVPDAKYHVYVKHYTNGVYDGNSKLTLLAYDMGKESWMGFACDFVWLDEEPPEDIMGQATRSIVDRGGSIAQTFTPENGRTQVLINIEESWSVHNGSWLDASGGDFDLTLQDGTVLHFKTVHSLNGREGHLTEEKVRDAVKGLLPHEARMRILGEPMQGSGLIFSYPQDQVMCQPIEIPNHFKRVCAIDFGGISQKSHPSAVVWMAYDENNDTAYVYDCLKLFSNDPAEVAARMLSRPQWITTFYPHDMEKTVPGGGTVADLYRKYGINMFHTHATNPDEEKGEGKGGIKIEPGLVDMNARFADRRLRIFNTLPEIWDEIRNYHTKKTADGSAKIVDRDDDLIAAIRYCLMMLRHGISEDEVDDYEYQEDSYQDDFDRSAVTGY